MDFQSQIKVINAGFIIIRCDDSPNPRIKVKGDAVCEWRTLEKFDSKAARDRRFKELLKEPSYISD